MPQTIHSQREIEGEIEIYERETDRERKKEMREGERKKERREGERKKERREGERKRMTQISYS